MNFFESIIDAVNTIADNKLRSGLTMLGIIIGVASVIVMVAIGEGAQKNVTNRIQQLGSNLLIITPGGTNQTNVRGSSGGGRGTLTNDDVAMIQAETAGLSAISPEYSGRKQVILGSQNTNATITGVLPAYETVRNAHVAAGRFISAGNQQQLDRVAVLGQTVAANLFNGADPIGTDIRIENGIFTVIGVMESKGQQGFGNADNVVFIPLSTAQVRVFGVGDQVSTIYISVADAQAIEASKTEITNELLQSHQISNAEDADFSVLNQTDAIETLNDVTKIFTILLGGIAAISLIVGGIGVMNIMLVSVTERTREIGIRKAVGARRRDILAQFLTESTLISVFGGMVGIILAVGGTIIIRKYAPIETTVSLFSIILAFVFSVSIGIFFGIFPAYKASRLKPIDALRFE
ncbi:MAG: ABC transporter permease [Patescibacteria group bacterium]